MLLDKSMAVSPARCSVGQIRITEGDLWIREIELTPSTKIITSPVHYELMLSDLFPDQELTR
jgi:hypothetical protein